jgi:hypothetical protein
MLGASDLGIQILAKSDDALFPDPKRSRYFRFGDFFINNLWVPQSASQNGTFLPANNLLAQCLNFAKNLVAIRCEKRVALVTRRPASFITGTFTTSPA